MKKILAFLVLSAVVLLSGCGGQQEIPAAPTNNNGTLSVGRAPSSSAEDDASAPDAVPEEADQEDSADGGEEPGDEEEQSEQEDGDVIEIKDSLFIAQTNDIYLNVEDYVGKTVRYQGIYDSFYWEDEDITYTYVIRYGPGCCGDDGMAGFEISWDGAGAVQDDWVEVEGQVELYEENGWQYVRLNISSLTVLEERGLEFVTT